MGNIVFNIAKGRIKAYAELPLTNDALLVVLLKAAGLEADGTIADHDTLSALLAAANDEADFTGYGARKALASIAFDLDDTNNWLDIDAADPTAWTNSGASQAIGACLICYDDDTTGGTDANIVPLVKLDCVVTFDTGVPVTLNFNAEGFARAA